jgi:uncharacterized phage-associated protein
MKELFELKEKINNIIKTEDKSEIKNEIESLKNYKVSNIFKENIIDTNLSYFNEYDLDNFRFHSLLTIQQTMTEVSGLGLKDIQEVLKNKNVC